MSVHTITLTDSQETMLENVLTILQVENTEDNKVKILTGMCNQAIHRDGK